MNKISKIYNYLKIHDELHTSGQPEIEELHLLKKEGFEVVVNLREEHEMDDIFDEEKLISELGLNYHKIPLILDIVDNEILETFFSTLEKVKGKKTLIHCHRNIRVSALIGFYKVLKENVPKEVAFANLRNFKEITPETNELLDEIINDYRDKK